MTEQIRSSGQVLSYGNSFYADVLPEKSPFSKREFSAPLEAFRGAWNKLKLLFAEDDVTVEKTEEKLSYVFKGISGPISNPKAKLVYLIKGDRQLVFTWRVEVDLGRSWLLIYVDARDNTIIHGVVDFVAEADYQI